MKIFKKIIFCGLLAALMFGFYISSIKTNDLNKNYVLLNKIEKEEYQLNSQSSVNNYEIFQNIFEDKINEYNSLGRFLQIYEPSLQATYYALYILQTIDMLNSINQTEIINYILSNYDSTTHYFMDDYSYRYLDTDSLLDYYPLTTILEVNCYAILALEILGALDLINSQEFIDFIWSCYNPITSGFIGQSYSSNLLEYFKISTLDNTYYAIKVLNILTDWSLYPSEKNDLIAFINNLQSIDTWDYKFGGFLNDNNDIFKSLYTSYPNLLSCYYAIKGLEIFNMIETINIDNFHQYLSGLYDNEKKFFSIDYLDQFVSNNETNLAASAIGLELSKLTNYSECDMNSVVNFLLNHRNSYGTWDCSTNNKNRELIDTFEVIGSLKDTDEISNLTINDKIQINNTLQKYYQYNGFSLISNDFLSMNLIYTIVNSFNLYDKMSDLPITYFYNRILNSCYYHPTFTYLSFYSCVDLFSNINYKFRSNPIEYNTDSEHIYNLDNNNMMSHKSTFHAIDSLIKLFKLDDFKLEYDLNELVSDIINTQFLDSEYENYGGFLPSLKYQNPDYNPELKNREIQIEYSYYACKELELLTNYLGLGKIKDLGININALYTYIDGKIIITPDLTYFSDNNYDTIQSKIQKTYYMVYILKALEIYNLNDQKIKSFLEENLDYSNLINIYYSWKLSELLGLNISFDLKLSQDLINNIYNQELNEFYITKDREKISQEAFLWIQEMAKLDKIKINCTNRYVDPGSKFNLTITLNNIVLNYFGPTIIVKYESEKLGTIIFKKVQNNNTYICEIIIPNDLYQLIEGNITIYNGITKIGEKQIIFYLTETPPSTTPLNPDSDDDSVDAKDSIQNNDKKIDAAIPLVIMLMAFPAIVITISYKMKRDSFIESK